MTNTRSQGMENGAAVTSNLTGTQQDVDLSHFLLIEKSSRHAELQCKLPYFVHTVPILFLASVYFIQSPLSIFTFETTSDMGLTVVKA